MRISYRCIAPFVLLSALLVVGWAPGRLEAQSGSAELERAYRRELAFLAAEKGALQNRVQELEQEADKKIGAAQSEVEALQGRVMAVSLEADRLSDLLLETDRQVEGLQEGDDVLANLLTQADAALEKGGVKLPELPQDAVAQAKIEQVDFAFAESLGLLRKYNGLRHDQGQFFTASGTKVDGEVVRAGNVAAFGAAEGVAGVLAPAGEGKLKVWPQQPSPEVARALARGEAPEPLRIFLFESLDEPVESKAAQSPVEHVASGGLIAWVIVAAGLLSVLMILVRAALLWRAAAHAERLVAEISPQVAQGNIERAIETCRKAHSAAGRVLKVTLQHIGKPREQLEDIISEAVLHEQPTLERFGAAIMVLAAVSPLLGLLGTVTGMISTFDVITEFGTGNPKLLSGGISEALITTELGLIVAIPALLCGNMLSGWADNIKDGMDKSALRITNLASGVRIDEEARPQAPSAGGDPDMVPVS